VAGVVPGSMGDAGPALERRSRAGRGELGGGPEAAQSARADDDLQRRAIVHDHLRAAAAVAVADRAHAVGDGRVGGQHEVAERAGQIARVIPVSLPRAPELRSRPRWLSEPGAAP